MAIEGREKQKTAEAGVSRGSERVTLACRALAAATRDLRIACRRDEMAAAEVVECAADALEAESVRVCELAEELGELAEALANGWGQSETRAMDPGEGDRFRYLLDGPSRDS